MKNLKSMKIKIIKKIMNIKINKHYVIFMEIKNGLWQMKKYGNSIQFGRKSDKKLNKVLSNVLY